MSAFTTNALDELWSTIQEVRDGYDAELVAVDIQMDTSTPGDYSQVQYNDEMTHVQFIVGKDKDIDKALAPLDQEYEHGYGRQYLFGTVWFTKGIWATRYEYDGSEHWDIHVYPNLPDSNKE